MDQFLDDLDGEFGFGSVKEGSFEHTGRFLRKDMDTGCITVSALAHVFHCRCGCTSMALGQWLCM